MPGADLVWQQIVGVERGLRTLVRDVYTKRFGEGAARKIEEAIPEAGREALSRALRSRPVGSEVQQEARARIGAPDAKRTLNEAVRVIASVRDEIAHVREVSPQALQKTSVACTDLLAFIKK